MKPPTVGRIIAAVVVSMALAACGSSPNTPPSNEAPTSDQTSGSTTLAAHDAQATSTSAPGSATSQSTITNASQQPSTPRPLRPFKYGISGDLAIYWHVYVGQELGIFEKHGIDLQKVTTRSGSATDLLSLLVAGEVDMADALPDPAIAAAANGTMVTILNLTGPSPYSLAARKGLNSFDDLKALDKVKVAVSSPTTSVAGLSRLILTQEGIPADKLDLIVTGGTSARLAALSANAVDVGLLVQPADFKAQAQGMKVLADSTAYAPWYGVTDLVLPDSVEANCDLYRDFFAAMREIHEFLVDPANKDQAIDILVTGTGASAADAESTYQLYMKDKTMQGVNDPTETAEQTAKMLTELGTPSYADPGALVDTSCVS